MKHPLEDERFFWSTLAIGTLAAVGLAVLVAAVITTR